MYDFITDLFNIDKKLIKNIEVHSSKDLTELHISLKPEKLRCPYCHGITHLHGYSKSKVINHSKLGRIPLLFLISRIPIFPCPIL